MVNHPEQKRDGDKNQTTRTRMRLTGPMIVACHWNMLSPVGPALHDEGGSRPRSINSCEPNNDISQRVPRRIATPPDPSAHGRLFDRINATQGRQEAQQDVG